MTGPVDRMLMVLARLRTHPTRIWRAQDLRRDIPEYSDHDGDRNWQYDLRALRARGMVKTGITRRDTPQRTGVQYALPIKPINLYLSEQEHAALIEARRARGATDQPGPLDRDTRRGRHLATIAEALRRLEECGEWMTVGDLAHSMGERPDRLWRDLKRVWFLDLAPGTGSIDLLKVEDCELRPSRIRVCVWRKNDPRRPLHRAGLDLLGVGAYTLEETIERLDLIEDVLSGGLPGDAAALESAKTKLLQWRDQLTQP